MKTIILIIITTITFMSSCLGKNFNSKFLFNFNMPDKYELFNSLNLYDVYDYSNKDLLIKAQINLSRERLKKQDIELLYNFSSHLLNNISILVFNENYKINKKNVLKQCKKILRIERKIGKRKVGLKECRMHKEPQFADWSMYRENESSYKKGATTQQIIFLYKKKEYVITSGCWGKCERTKKDLFNMIESIKF
jgi:hypothetical protein